MQVPPIQQWQLNTPLPLTNGLLQRKVEGKTALTPADLENIVPCWQDPLVIPVFCDPVDEAQTHPPEAFEKALLAWQNASKGAVQFKRLTQKMADDDGIFISWSDETNPQRPYEVGRTVNQTQVKDGQAFIYRSEIVLQRNPRINQHLDVEAQGLQLYATFLHEIGHALGMEHTQDPHSVMFHRSLQNHQFTTEDLAQVQRLYKQ
jgi:predicted Zn-dependent protease